MAGMHGNPLPASGMLNSQTCVAACGLAPLAKQTLWRKLAKTGGWQTGGILHPLQRRGETNWRTAPAISTILRLGTGKETAQPQHQTRGRQHDGPATIVNLFRRNMARNGGFEDRFLHGLTEQV
jgi:hypothetical protein